MLPQCGSMDWTYGVRCQRPHEHLGAHGWRRIPGEEEAPVDFLPPGVFLEGSDWSHDETSPEEQSERA